MTEGRESAGEKPDLLFEDLSTGRRFRPLAYPITKELVRNFVDIVGDRNPLYEREEASPGAQGRSRPPIAPPGLAAVYARLSYLQDHAMPSGGVLAKQEFEFLTPARVGDVLEVEATVEESLVDAKGKKRVTFRIEAANQAGETVSRIRLYAIWPK